MAEYVTVKPGPDCPKDKIALWEVHPDHPMTEEFPNGGEAYVANEKPRLVARTPEVNLRIRNGMLVEVASKEAKAADPAPPAPVDTAGNPVAPTKATSPSDQQPAAEPASSTNPQAGAGGGKG